MVANVIEDHVVTLVVLGEILFRVIDEVIRADGSHEIDIPCAANSRYLPTKEFGDLHGKCSYTSGRAVNQHPLPGLNLSLISQPLQRSEGGNRQRSGLVIRD